MKQVETLTKTKVSTRTVVLAIVGVTALGAALVYSMILLTPTGPTVKPTYDFGYRAMLIGTGNWMTGSNQIYAYYPYNESGGIINWHEAKGELQAASEGVLPSSSFTPSVGYYFQTLDGSFRINLWGKDASDKLKLYIYNPNYQGSGAAKWQDESTFTYPSAKQISPDLTFQPLAGYYFKVTNPAVPNDFRIHLWGTTLSGALKLYIYNPSKAAGTQWADLSTTFIGAGANQVNPNFAPKAGYVIGGASGYKIYVWGALSGSPAVYILDSAGANAGKFILGDVAVAGSGLPNKNILAAYSDAGVQLRVWLINGASLESYIYTSSGVWTKDSAAVGSSAGKVPPTFIPKIGFYYTAQSGNGSCEMGENFNIEPACPLKSGDVVTLMNQKGYFLNIGSDKSVQAMAKSISNADTEKISVTKCSGTGPIKSGDCVTLAKFVGSVPFATTADSKFTAAVGNTAVQLVIKKNGATAADLIKWGDSIYFSRGGYVLGLNSADITNIRLMVTSATTPTIDSLFYLGNINGNYCGSPATIGCGKKANGSSCGTDNTVCVSGICQNSVCQFKTPAANGGACNDDNNCLSGICQLKICRATRLLENGAACNTANPGACASGICSRTGNSNICSSGVSDGYGCTTHSQCASFYCANTTCLPSPCYNDNLCLFGENGLNCPHDCLPIGATCTVDSSRANNCDSGICRVICREVGSAVTGDACDSLYPQECISGACRDSICQVAGSLANGEACRTPQECASGICEADYCRPDYPYPDAYCCAACGENFSNESACPLTSADEFTLLAKNTDNIYYYVSYAILNTTPYIVLNPTMPEGSTPDQNQILKGGGSLSLSLNNTHINMSGGVITAAYALTTKSIEPGTYSFGTLMSPVSGSSKIYRGNIVKITNLNNNKNTSVYVSGEIVNNNLPKWLVLGTYCTTFNCPILTSDFKIATKDGLVQ